LTAQAGHWLVAVAVAANLAGMAD